MTSNCGAPRVLSNLSEKIKNNIDLAKMNTKFKANDIITSPRLNYNVPASHNQILHN